MAVEESIVDAMAALLATINSPAAFDKVYAVPVAIGQGQPMPFAMCYLDAARPISRADNAKRWTFEIKIVVVCNAGLSGDTQASIAAMRKAVEDKIDANNGLNGTCQRSIITEWKYGYAPGVDNASIVWAEGTLETQMPITPASN